MVATDLNSNDRHIIYIYIAGLYKHVVVPVQAYNGSCCVDIIISEERDIQYRGSRYDSVTSFSHIEPTTSELSVQQLKVLHERTM